MREFKWPAVLVNKPPPWVEPVLHPLPGISEQSSSLKIEFIVSRQIGSWGCSIWDGAEATRMACGWITFE
jgi:hypothetical protein